MLRLFILISILFLDIFACKGGYISCKKKLIDSNSYKNNIFQIPVTRYKRLVFSSVKPKAKILKEDPFLHLYLIQTDKYFPFPFKINNFLSFGVASVNTKNAIEGKIIKQQVGLNHLATFSEKVQTPSLLTNSCCALEGIVTYKGIIQKEYIERFLNTKDTYYSDIGIRLYDSDKNVKVKRSNPFKKDNPFKNNDIILSFDGKRVKTSASLMRKILFSKIGSKHNIKIKRGSKILRFKVTTFKRIGGGYKSDTFLESKGLYFNNKLIIEKINGIFKKYGLKVGDKLLKINDKFVYNFDDLGMYIDAFNKKSSLLFERDRFQFFININ